jgi:hypothetical protein
MSAKCKKCKTKLALASVRYPECVFDDEPYESGSYDKVTVDGHDIIEVQADNIIYMDICPKCNIIDNVWIDE